MLDIKRIRDAAKAVKAGLAAKEYDAGAQIDRILALDVQRRELIGRSEALKAEQNKSSKEIPAIKKAGGDTAAIKTDTEALEKAFYALSEKLYKQSGAQGDAGGFDPNAQPGGFRNAGNGDDTVYNADFEDKTDK